MRVGEACEEFIRYCDGVRKLSAHTVRAYRLDLRRFAQFTGSSHRIEACDRATLHLYVQQLFSVHRLKETSAKRHLASLRSMFRWLEAQGFVSENPFQRARIHIRTPQRLPRLLSRYELAALLRRRPSSDFAEITAHVAVELLFATGVRVAELAGLRDEDIDLRSGVITITGKGNRQRRVYVPDRQVCELLSAYRRIRNSRSRESPMFLVNSRGTGASPQFLRRIIRRFAEAADVRRRVTPHMFRHSLATYLLEEGVDIRYVQRLLGHRSIATTEIYTHVADAALRVHVTQHHPRRTIVSGA